MAKRTNKRQAVKVQLRGNASRRIASLFIGRDKRSLKEIYVILSKAIVAPQFSKSAVRSILRRWIQKRILFVDGRNYILNPRGGREVLIEAIESGRKRGALVQLTSEEKVEKERMDLKLVKRVWDENLDLPKAWEENDRLYCRIQEHIAIAMWELCENKPKDAKRDRSAKASHKEEEYTLVAFPKGRFHIYSRGKPIWKKKLEEWLKKGGFGTSDLLLVSKAIYHHYGEAIGITEVPITKKLDQVREFKINMELGRLKASLELVHSHYPEEGELEAKGTKRFRDEWLASLTGATLAIMAKGEELETLRDTHEKLKEDFSKLEALVKELMDNKEATNYSQMMIMLGELTEKIGDIDDKIKVLEIPKEEPVRKEPDYYI